MKSSSRSDLFIPLLAITLGAVSSAGATTTLTSTGTWSATTPLNNGQVVTSGPGVFNSVSVSKGAGNLGGNVAIGMYSINSPSNTGNYMTAVGLQALMSNTSGASNTGLGHAALEGNTTAGNNTAVGTATMRTNSTGSNNSAVGAFSMQMNVSGWENSALGATALYRNTTGYLNSAVGVSALQENTTGLYNTGLGGHALFFNQTGSNNIAIGVDAGTYWANWSTPLSNTSNSIYIGSGSRGKDNNDNNSIVIGTAAIGEGANTTVIGTPATTTTHLFGQTLSNSLSVTGATQLNGTVTLAAPQGDVSMGIYGN